ncbi:hypothetical protein [Natrinema salsiterrestre]|uniref:DUF4129 domain-containing protein n=1 Tax=Natrinema salsiterrestre TaxID=2950540 RepID=A0A9Q4KZU3_9EURY|nr:hypothetical protein [Natrinema salsiterrestre]MDF9744864.1 hypothetical protein [Natrinema salsiterrestre]
MGSGPSAGSRFLAVAAVACAICGLVLAASAMGPLASVSPASDLFGDGFGDRTGGESTARPMPSGGSGGGGGDGGGPEKPSGGSGLLEDIDPAEIPIPAGLLEELMALLGGSGAGGSGGAPPSDGGEPSTADGSSSQGETTDDSAESTDDGGEDDSSTTEQSLGETDETQAAPDQSDGGSDAAADGSQQDGGSDADEPSLPESVPGLSDRALIAGFAAIALSIVGYVFYTRDDPIGTLRSIPGRIVSVALAGVVACSQALERGLAALRGVTSIADLPGLALAAIANAIRSARASARAAGSSVSASLFGGAADRTDGDATADEHVPARERIRQAFESVIEASPMYRGRAATATPTDVARSATDAGVPDEPVETITESFRDVEYGDRDPASYLERTTTAHDRLRDALAADADGDQDESGTEPTTEAGSDE